MKPKITFVTALIRPQNLVALERSINAVLGDQVAWNWIVIVDQKFVSDPSIVPNVNAYLFYVKIDQKSYGFLEKNVALELIQEDSWVYFLDDDTELHPNFLNLFEQALHTDSELQGMVFGQLLPDGSARESAVPGLPDYLGKIDMCQYLLKRSAIGTNRFLAGFGADGEFFTRIYKQNPHKFFFTLEVGVHHNNLRTGEPWTPEFGYGRAY